ncbi:hypothetical protein NQ314_004251 [Rhamnusium bicolor]|uniref:THAP-type domain-containing protein n=1 Tax=Rhamnusium bicolor TaxID=1586634 RepID=A0AAV8ZJK7_9CUCU|nr:hypothetical protein NQ314_004251 [Rhamnusium bicolor]
MVMCWAPECKHYNQRETCKFFKFPKDAKERMRWKKFIRRSEEPGPGAFLCSCHFPGGKRENGPQLFQHNIAKRFSYTSPEKKDKKRLKLTRSDVAEALANITRTQSGIPEDIHQVEIERATSPTASIEATVNIYLNPQPSTSRAADDKDILSTTMLNAENYFLRRELEQKESMRRTAFIYEEICHFDNLVSLYTGLPNAGIFDSVYQLLENIEVNYYLEWNVDKISKKDQLLMYLMKLRQNFPHEDLAQRFAVSQATVTNIVITWIHVLHEILYKQMMSSIPSRNKNKTCLPNCCSTFTNCRIILDCTEIATMVPRSSMTAQKATYSAYKHKNTWKALIGVAPNGVVTFVSDLYPGSTSDKKIVQHCKILEQMETGDLILADKGFLLKDILPPGVNLNIPPFLVTSQFTPEQVYRTETIARARIHVERAIRRMKCYKILDFIPYSLQSHASCVVQVIGALTNLQPPLIREVAQAYSSSTDNE